VKAAQAVQNIDHLVATQRERSAMVADDEGEESRAAVGYQRAPFGAGWWKLGVG
jgi:hypothetical protein